MHLEILHSALIVNVLCNKDFSLCGVLLPFTDEVAAVCRFCLTYTIQFVVGKFAKIGRPIFVLEVTHTILFTTTELAFKDATIGRLLLTNAIHLIIEPLAFIKRTI